jgi:outer membrane lipoprotein-sorting protein
MGSHTISDGRSVWKYVAAFQQYTKVPASRGIIPIAEGPRDILAGEGVLDRLQSAVRVRREKLSVDGQQIDCDVIEATYESDASDKPGEDTQKTFWVDVQRGVILKVSSLIKMDSPETGGARAIAQSVTVTSLKLNQPLRDSLFVFVPPAGTKEVAELVPPRRKPEISRQPEP